MEGQWSVSMGWGRLLGLDNWETLDWGGHPNRAGIPVRGQRPTCEDGVEGSWEHIQVKGKVWKQVWGGEMVPVCRSPGKPGRGCNT